MFRYVGLIWDPSNPDGVTKADDFARRLAHERPWRKVLHANGLQVWCCGNLAANAALTAHLLANGAGVVLGTVFLRNSSGGSSALGPNVGFSEQESTRIVDTRGKALISNYW